MVRETNRPTRWRWNPCALEELARHWMASKSEVLRRAPVCVRWGIPWERGRPARTLFLQTACHPRPLPCKAHQSRLYGDLFHRAGLCAGGTPALPGGLSSRAVLPPPREWSEKQIDRLAGGRIRARWRSWHVTGWRRSPKCCGGLLIVFGGASPGSAGVPPAPYSCKQPAIQGHSLARRTKAAFTGISSIVPSFVRARRPRSRVVFVRAGRPRSRVVFVRAGRPRSQVVFTPSPRPTLGGSLSSILQRLSGPLAVLRAPSWITLFAFLWISYVSWFCSSATISRATSRARSGWPGGREMAATTGWPPPP